MDSKFLKFNQRYVRTIYPAFSVGIRFENTINTIPNILLTTQKAFDGEQGGLVGLVTNSCFEGVLWLLQISNSLKKCRGAI